MNCDMITLSAKTVHAGFFVSIACTYHNSIIVGKAPVLSHSRAVLADVQVGQHGGFAFMSEKQCSKCKQFKTATLDFFPPHKHTKDGLNSWCRACYSARKRTPEQNATQREYARRKRAENPELLNERTRQWRAKNPDYHKVKAKEWRVNNRAAYVSYAVSYRASNPDYQREWARNNKSLVNAKTHRYRARKRNLPNTYTAQDWRRALEYFNGCCAVCGRQLDDLFGAHTAAMDHWLPLNVANCPGTVKANIVPLCHGQGGCNNRKSGRDPVEFLTTEFGTRFAKRKLTEIELFFKYMEAL